MNIKKMTKNLDRDFVGSKHPVNGNSDKYTGVKPSLVGHYGWKQNAKMYGVILAGSLAMAFGYGVKDANAGEGAAAALKIINMNNKNPYAHKILGMAADVMDNEKYANKINKQLEKIPRVVCVGDQDKDGDIDWVYYDGKGNKYWAYAVYRDKDGFSSVEKTDEYNKLGFSYIDPNKGHMRAPENIVIINNKM